MIDVSHLDPAELGYSVLMARITPAVCRAARALLGWKQRQLALAADISINTVRNFEGEKGEPIPITVLAIERALEKAGIEFIEADGGGAGVRFRQSPGGPSS